MHRKFARDSLAPRNASYQGVSSLVPNHAIPPPAFAHFASQRSRPGGPCGFPSPFINVDRECAEHFRICPNIFKFPQYRGNSSTGSTFESQLNHPQNGHFKPSFHPNLNKINSLQCIVLGIPCAFINLQKPWCKILYEWPSLSRLRAFSDPSTTPVPFWNTLLHPLSFAQDSIPSHAPRSRMYSA